MGDAGQQGLMRTTLLNPTVWLLWSMIVMGVIGAVRGRTARASVDALLRLASAWPVLVVLLALAVLGISSRAVLGFVSPGAYAEEVVAARTFLEERDLYAAGQSGSQVLPAAAIANIPWLTSCQGNAMENRAKFFTDHAHTPMLLLAGVPVVYLAGARSLYLLLLMASLVAIAIMVGVIIKRAGLTWNSPAGMLLIAAVAGWQPVLAGVRQGDAVLPAAGLVALAWYLIGRRSGDRAGADAGAGAGAWAGVAGAVAACLAVPALGVLPALWRTAPRAAAIAAGVFLVVAAATVAAAGFSVVPGFLQTVSETARAYADAPANYALAGRALRTGVGTPVLAAALLTVLICSWWRGTTVDAAFATFGMAGLMIAPVLWSQHLALLLIPMTVLFVRIWRDGSSLALAALALVALLFSLPDTIAIRMAQISSFLTLTAISSALVAVWAWTAFSRDALGPTPFVHPALSAVPPVHSP